MSRIDWHLSLKYLCSGLILQSIESPTQPMSYSPPPVVNVELHGCSISSFCVKTIGYVHPNPSTTTPCSAAVRKSGSKMQHVTIGACALSARTYNARVQGSDARLRNHFDIYNIYRYRYKDAAKLCPIFTSLVVICSCVHKN